MPEGHYKEKAPAVLPFESDTDKDLKLKTETKAIVRLKKLDINTRKSH